jgi:hypothetical protein
MPDDSQAKAPQATPSPQPDAHALVISHRHGVDITLHPSVEDARIALAGFARRWWHETDGGPGVAGPPDDDDEAIGTYFEHQEDESYTIGPVSVPARDIPAPAARIARARAGDPSSECVLLLVNGHTIRTDTYAANPAGSSYVRVGGPDGHEITYWSCTEWADDPQIVMAAILGAAVGGPARVPSPAGDGAALPARHQRGDSGQVAAEPPHYTAGQVADVLLRNPASSIDPGDVELLVGEPVTADEPHRAVRELEMADGTVYRLLIEEVRP